MLGTLVATSLFSCNKSKDASVPVTGLIVEQPSVELEIDATLDITVKIIPENATDKTLTYTSSDEAIATVETGKITAVAAGEATISIKSTNGKEVKMFITVNKPEFKTPAELVGKWTGVEFNLYDIAKGEVITEAQLIALLTSGDDGMSQEDAEAWVAERRTKYSYDANADCTMVWHVDVKQQDESIVNTPIDGVMTENEEVAASYVGTFDRKKANLSGADEEIKNFSLVDGRIKEKSSWNDNYDAIFYYVVGASNGSQTVKCNAIAPSKFMKK